MIKRFWCGKCEIKKVMTREDLRKHLRDEHLIKRRKTNYIKNGRLINQPWWKQEEFK